MSEQKSTDFVADLNKDGPYAFPFVAPGALCLGMSLRDYFAAKFMQGFIAAPDREENYSHVTKVECAKRAYEMADAMLAARGAA